MRSSSPAATSRCWRRCCCSFCASAPFPRGIALFLTILAAWLYAGITGWQAPVLRSAAGMSLYGIGRCFFREGRLLNILAAVALLFVVADPEQLFDASFQLSFLAVALIGAFVVPALNATSGPLARGLADLEDEKKDIRAAPEVRAIPRGDASARADAVARVRDSEPGLRGP